MRKIPVFGWSALLLLGLLVNPLWAQEGGELPRRLGSSYWQPYELDAETVGLYHLDRLADRDSEGLDVEQLLADTDAHEDLLDEVAPSADTRQAGNANLSGASATLEGPGKFSADGRFGGGVALSGGGSGVVCPVLRTTGKMYEDSRTIEFWLKLSEQPQDEAIVLTMCQPKSLNLQDAQPASRQGATPTPDATLEAGLMVNAKGHLVLVWDRQILFTTCEPIPVQQWHHLAMVVKCVAGNSTVGLLISGHSLTNQTVAERYAKSMASDSPYAIIGNGKRLDQGIVGTVDEIRISRCARQYYQQETAWQRPSAEQRIVTGRPYFRDGEDLLFYLNFDRTLKPVVAAPGTISPDYRITQADEELNPGKIQRLFPSGVSGHALMLGKDSLSPVYRGKGNLRPAQGTIAFWFRPANWDNLYRTPQFGKAKGTRFGLFQVKGMHAPGSFERQFREGGDLFWWSLCLNPPSTADNPPVFHPGRWRHMAIVWEGIQFRYFVDGVEREAQGAWNLGYSFFAGGGQDPAHTPIPAWWLNSIPNTIQFRRNRWSEDGPEPPNTLIDEFRIYRRVLSELEINNLIAMVDRRRELRELPPLEMALQVNGALGTWKFKVTPLVMNTEKCKELVVTITNAAQEELARRHYPVEGLRTVQGELKLPAPLGFGRYQTQVRLLGQDGSVVAEAQEEYPWQQPPWWQCRAGETEQPIPPWTPVEVDGNLLSVWGRQIVMDASGLPARVVSQNRDVLTGPLALTIKSAGHMLAMDRAAPAITITKATAARVDWQGRLTNALLSVQTDGYMEFDGMMWFRITIAPRPGRPLLLDALQIRIPYQPAAAELVHWYTGGSAGGNHRNPRNNFIGSLPEGRGAVMRSNSAERWNHAAGQRGSFIPYVNLTGMKRGMAWFAENDQGWTQSTEIPAVAIERQDQSVDLVLNIIGQPVQLAQARTLAFGLHPIPVKPLEPNWRLRPGGLGNCIADSMNGNNLKGRQGVTVFYICPEDDWDAVRRRLQGEGRKPGAPTLHGLAKRRARQFQQAYGRPPAPFEQPLPGLYWDLQYPGQFPPHTQAWGEAWAGSGPLRYTPEFNDYVSWAWNNWIRETDKQVGATYMDECWNRPVNQGPVAYTLADGHVQPGFQFLGYRERLKRQAVISHQNGLPLHHTGHVTHMMYIPYTSFFNYVLDGEDHYSNPKKQDDFIDHWPAARLRFMHNGKWGIVSNWLNWIGNSFRCTRGLEAWTYRQRRAYTAHLAMHDIKWTFAESILDQFKLREEGTVFFPYWEDRGLVRSNSHPQRLRLAAWKRPGQCLVLLANYGDQRIEAEVGLNPTVMGLGEESTLHATDVDRGLLRYFRHDLTTALTQVELPQLQNVAQIGDESEADLEALLEGRGLDLSPAEREARRAQDPDGQYQWEETILSCPVRRHDYRLFLFGPSM